MICYRSRNYKLTFHGLFIQGKKSFSPQEDFSVSEQYFFTLQISLPTVMLLMCLFEVKS